MRITTSVLEGSYIYMYEKVEPRVIAFACRNGQKGTTCISLTLREIISSLTYHTLVSLLSIFSSNMHELLFPMKIYLAKIICLHRGSVAQWQPNAVARFSTFCGWSAMNSCGTCRFHVLPQRVRVWRTAHENQRRKRAIDALFVFSSPTKHLP